MAKSAKARKEKKKDFAKPKLKVGKGRAKPTNATDTSFKARSISVLQQSLTAAAPSTSTQFTHHLNLLNHNSDTQRLQSLAYLTTSLHNTPTPPLPVSVILPKIVPLIRDTSNKVRSQLLLLLHELPPEDVKSNTEQLLLWTRLGLTHLSSSIRLSSLEVLEWLLNTAGNEVVACPGGWSKTLRCLAGLLGWDNTETVSSTGMRVSNSGRPGAGNWTSTPSTAGKSSGDVKLLTKTLSVLSLFLEVGLLPTLTEKSLLKTQEQSACRNFPLWHLEQHLLTQVSNPFGHLNLFGAPRDEEGMGYEDRGDRVRYFGERWRGTFLGGVDRVKREGGGVGRVAMGVEKVIIMGG
ncbi:hypothetical protein EJ08DRAFT_676955 [Tothia fuscella]|uniref:Pre-rRNA-processing protein n=1 Tax=Tothia fuscella TaxID=1048955 RepID=A0A9P4NW73_9PEZI|nr:hypothetical protein EJ08DRAFT_676955 [Tothia fuscella]